MSENGRVMAMTVVTVCQAGKAETTLLPTRGHAAAHKSCPELESSN